MCAPSSLVLAVDFLLWWMPSVCSEPFLLRGLSQVWPVSGLGNFVPWVGLPMPLQVLAGVMAPTAVLFFLVQV